MNRQKIHLIAAARPNFMKVAPLYHALQGEPWADVYIVHTGQHYDMNMSESFFRDLRLCEPAFHLNVGSGTHAEQAGKVMMEYEKVCAAERPNLVVVVGDVNSTMACTLASVKLGMATAHLEAGLRSFDRSMPEEINRIVTDALADLLWTPSPDADENLRREGIGSSRIKRVGNIMIDSFEMLRSRIVADTTVCDLGLVPREFAVVTFHRPSNVDSAENLRQLVGLLLHITSHIEVVFPVHPRTLKSLRSFGLLTRIETCAKLHLTAPLPYVNFMNLLMQSRFVVTDSGGIQEETTYLGIPCLTLRDNTERPITVRQGTNRLTGPAKVRTDLEEVLNNGQRRHVVPELWDGKTASRVVASIREFLL